MADNRMKHADFDQIRIEFLPFFIYLWIDEDEYRHVFQKKRVEW